MFDQNPLNFKNEASIRIDLRGIRTHRGDTRSHQYSNINTDILGLSQADPTTFQSEIQIASQIFFSANDIQASKQWIQTWRDQHLMLDRSNLDQASGLSVSSGQIELPFQSPCGSIMFSDSISDDGIRVVLSMRSDSAQITAKSSSDY
jgi:hypothetical protein